MAGNLSEIQKNLLLQGHGLFSNRLTLMSFWQESSDQFYPERANFTIQKNMGYEFADYLTTSVPILFRRDLGDTFSSMLRPTNLNWFHMKPGREDLETTEAMQWMEWATGLMKRAMYDTKANFVRATKEGDHDFATFGQCVISVEMNRMRDALLFRCHHLRDVAWIENAECQIDTIFHKWKYSVSDMVRQWPKTVHNDVRKRLEKEPFHEVNCMRIVVPSDRYESLALKRSKAPFVSLYIDVDNQQLLEETPSWTKIYCIPRWQTVSGSQYAYSPAVIAGLPDARLIQAQSLVLLEAGEKATNPPIVTVDGLLRGDAGLYAGGITYLDDAYDGKVGDAFAPVHQDYNGFQHGITLRDDVRNTLKEAFFLNKVALPELSKEMTAFEVGQRVQEYIRQALPLFEPMEQNYNGDLCEMAFETLRRANGFGNPNSIPKVIQGSTAIFKFESPLHDAEEKAKGQIFMQTRGILAEAAAQDQGSVNMVDVRKALRDTLQGIGTPAKWLRDDATMQKMDQNAAQKQQAAEMLQQMSVGADVAQKVGDAGQSLNRVQTGQSNMRA